MTLFKLTAYIDCETAAQADTVACERFGYDEMYEDPDTGKGFDYEITSFVISPGEVELPRPDPDAVRWRGPILYVGELRRLIEGLPDHVQVVLDDRDDWFVNVGTVHSPRPTEVDFDEVQTAWQCLTLWPGAPFDARQI